MAKTPAPKEEVAYVQLMVTSIKPDRTPYKQYGIELVPQRVLVSIPIPSKDVTVIYKRDGEGREVDGNTDYVVLTLAGLTSMTKQIADAIDVIHNQYLEEVKKGLR